VQVFGHLRGLLRARTALVAGAALIVCLTATGAAALAGGGGNDESSVVPARFAKITSANAQLPDLAQIAKWLPASMQDREVTVALKMAGDPVAVVDAKGGNALTNAQRASIRADLKGKQDAIAPSIQQAGGTVLGQMADAYNGILVRTTVAAIPTLSTLPGVTNVVSVKSFRPDNLHGGGVIDAPQAWQSIVDAGANPGAGVKVADVDSGVDYTHADFGGPGTVAAYTAAHAHADDATLDPSVSAWFGPAAPKVKGGFDFVGDHYDAAGTGAALTPVPDPNPLDCNSGSTAGHGTHVSGTLAGFGVKSDGTTYTGSYDASTVSAADATQLFPSDWKVGPGIAPKADLYMYRVFGCNGSSSVVSLGIDKAVADGVNVINLSLGSPFGGQDDPTSVAVQNALDAGVTVVASAGNSGSAGYIVGSPSTVNGALSVAAVDGSVANYPAATLTLGTSTIKAIDANAEDNAGSNVPTATLPVKVVRNADGSVSLGCSVAAFQAANVTGAIAVVSRGTCARVAKAIYGSQAGAAAVVMINTDGTLPPFEGKITQNPDTGEPATVTIPFLGVPGPLPDPATPGSGSAEAKALLAADGGTAAVAPSTIANPGYLRAVGFSSGGPRFGDSSPKPEVAAPGVSVTSAGVGTGSGGAVESGTSMAAPMTSGVAALVKQVHPTWGPAQIKAAIANTAQVSKLHGSPNARITGAGLIQADRALSTDVVATTGDNLDSLAFGFFQGAGAFSGNKTFTLTNYGSSTVTYNLASDSPALTLSTASVTLNQHGTAGDSADVTATLSVPASFFATAPSNDTGVVGPGGVLTLKGAVTATPASGPSLRVPFLLAYRGESNVTAGSPAPYAKQANNVYTTSVPVANSGIHAGTADVYAWGIQDPQESPAIGPDIRDVGVQSFSDGTIVFAVSNYDTSSTQAVSEYDVAIDEQSNGKPDYFVVGIDLGAVLTGSYNGQLGSFTIDAKTGALVDAFFAEAPTNSSVVELPTTAADLGLHGANTSFNYAVNSFSAIDGSHTDSTSAAAYDVGKPGVSSGQFETLAPNETKPIQLAVDFGKFQAAPALGWLVVSTDDPSGAAMADEVPVGTVK
jgi:minor extracellular serine protease Vpr